MLKIIQSRSCVAFQRCLARIPSVGWLVATPPDLTFASLESLHLEKTSGNYCIQTNVYYPHETYMIARSYSQLLLCGTYLMNLKTNQIVPTELVEEDGSRTVYLL
jgi:hypothetical protein